MNITLKILLAASVFFAISGGLFGPLYAIYVEDIGGGLIETGISWSIFMIISGIGIIIIGKLTDLLEKDELILVIGFSLGTFGNLGYLFITNKYELFILQVIFGIAHAITAPAFDSIYSKGLEKGKFAYQWSLCESVFLIFGGIGAIIGGIVASLYGFRTLFISMFIFGIIGVLLSLQLLNHQN
jgi:MFS family permease